MRCEEFLDHYSAYRDGTDPGLVAAMTDHMASCPACRAHDRAVREGVETLRGDLVAPSAGFEDRLRARLEETVAPETSPRLQPVALTVFALLVATLTIVAVRRPGAVATVAAEEPPMLLAKPRAQAGIPFVAFERNQ